MKKVIKSTNQIKKNYSFGLIAMGHHSGVKIYRNSLKWDFQNFMFFFIHVLNVVFFPAVVNFLSQENPVFPE